MDAFEDLVRHLEPVGEDERAVLMEHFDAELTERIATADREVFDENEGLMEFVRRAHDGEYPYSVPVGLVPVVFVSRSNDSAGLRVRQLRMFGPGEVIAG